jgi:N utilization substance protein B
MRRRKAREIALQLLFSLENQGKDGVSLPIANIENLTQEYFQNFGPKNHEEIVDTAFLRRLLQEILRDSEATDADIEKYSEHWKISRMTKIDRNIIRIGIEEIFHFEDIPPKVTLDECVEMAKRFGNEDSSAFVNGILDRALAASGRAKEK